MEINLASNSVHKQVCFDIARERSTGILLEMYAMDDFPLLPLESAVIFHAKAVANHCLADDVWSVNDFMYSMYGQCPSATGYDHPKRCTPHLVCINCLTVIQLSVAIPQDVVYDCVNCMHQERTNKKQLFVPHQIPTEAYPLFYAELVRLLTIKQEILCTPK